MPSANASDALARTLGLALMGVVCSAILVMWMESRWWLVWLQTGVFAAAAAWMAAYLAGRAALQFDWVPLPVLAVPLWGLFQLAANLTEYRWATWNAVLDWAVAFAALFIARQVFTTRPARLSLLRFALVFSTALSVLATVQLFTSPGKVYWLFPIRLDRGVLGPFLSRNMYAVFVELMLPLASAAALRRRSGGIEAFALVAGVLISSVVAGGSRAGIVLVLIETFVLLSLAVKHDLIPSHRRRSAAAIVVALIVVFGAIAGADLLLRRFSEVGEDNRILFYRSSAAMFADRPWTGFGLGTWPVVYPAYALFDDGTFINQAHSDWIELTVDGGVPVAAMLVCLVVLSGRRLIRSFWGAGVLFAFAHMAVDYPLQRSALKCLLFLVLGAAMAESRKPAARRRDPVAGGAGIAG